MYDYQALETANTFPAPHRALYGPRPKAAIARSHDWLFRVKKVVVVLARVAENSVAFDQRRPQAGRAWLACKCTPDSTLYRDLRTLYGL